MPRTAVSASTGSPTTRYSSVRLQVDNTTASWTSGCSRSSPSSRSAARSVSAMRSRRASGAVLYEVPSAISSDMALLHHVGELLDLARDARQLRGHDRHVDQHQREEDQVRRGDVLA